MSFFEAVSYSILIISLFYFIRILYICSHPYVNTIFPNNIISTHITRIAIVIPVQNEELFIRRVISSIHNCNYPQSLYDIYILADNCNDSTVTIAKSMNVFVVTDLENRMATKGGILESFFHQYDQVLRSHEIICIIDADTLVSKDFLRIINREFLLGHSVFQGKIEVINGKDSCASGFLSIIQSYMNICFYKYFSNYQKKSVLLAGKGMCISTSILRKLTYKSNTLIEDVELSFELLLQNYQIHYVPDMLIMTYQPEKLNELYYQQRRWLSGQFSIIKKYQQKTILSKLDTISCAKYYIAISYIGILFPICLFNLYTLMNLHYFLSFFYLASLTITVYLALLDKNCRINSFSLLLFPIFVLGLSMINCSCLIFPQKQWHPITRSFIKNRFLLLLRAKKKLNK